MSTYWLTIENTQEFIEGDSSTHKYLNELISHSIKEKNTSFKKEMFHSEYEHLAKVELVKNDVEKFFILDYSKLPVCYVLMEIAEEMMNEKAPIQPTAALRFAHEFAQLIRQPKLNTNWYQNLELQLKAYVLIWLHQVHEIDITEFIQSITDDMTEHSPELRTVDIIYKHVFPYLNDNTTKQFSTLIAMLGDERTKDWALHAVQEMGEINPRKAGLLYDYAKANNGVKYQNLLTHLLKGLYYFNVDFYLDEAIGIFKEDPLESLLAICWLDYRNEKNIRTAFDFVKLQKETTIEYQRILPAFFTRLIENEHTPEEIHQECFNFIGELANNEDQQLRSDLIWRTGLIKGNDEEKYDLLPKFLVSNNLSFLNDYFSRFESPAYLFDFLRQSFLEYGMSVNLNLFERAISGQYLLNKDEFTKELLKFFSDDLAIIRFAATCIMTSRYGGCYEVDFLELDEQGQLRVIETLLPSPSGIEELMPLIMNLRKSLHVSVRSKLETELIGLIRAYDHHLSDMAKLNLDLTNGDDKKLLDTLNTAYETHKKEREERLLIKELDPIENELQYADLYYRMEREKQAELMEGVSRQSIFGQMAKNVNIIRGSAFNLETNPNISVLGEIGSSQLIDRRYSINPDAYEWNFRMNAMAKNYNEKDDK